MAKIIKAVAGVLIRDNHVFMASRPRGKVYAGSWEFPGGKLENGETAVMALIRELREEIGIIAEIRDCRELTFLKQSYSHGDVELNVLIVDKWQGEIKALEGQASHWQDLSKECNKSPLLLTTQKILNLLYKPTLLSSIL